METGAQSARSWITDGIILALIPASAYLWAFLYEMGFCQRFDIPFDLISLNTTVVLAAFVPTIIIISILFFVFVVSLAISALLDGRLLFLIMMASLIIFSLMFAFLFPYKIEFIRYFRLKIDATWYLYLMIGLLVVSTILSFSVYIKIFQWLRDKLRSYMSLLGDSVEILAILIVVGVFAVFSYYVGDRTAAIKKEFQILEYAKEGSNSELVVLRVYGDFLITAPLVRSVGRGGNKIDRKFVVFKMSDNAPTSVKIEEVGTLRIKMDDLKQFHRKPQ
jgi:hypothetical protein